MVRGDRATHPPAKPGFYDGPGSVPPLTGAASHSGGADHPRIDNRTAKLAPEGTLVSDSIYLVQRISRNRHPRPSAVGLDLLATFEYMGSSEFEYGLRDAVKRLRTAPVETTTRPFTIDGVTRDLHLITHTTAGDTARSALDAWATGGDFHRPFRAKDYTAFPEVFTGDDDRDTLAWWSFDIDAIWTLDATFAAELTAAVNQAPAK